MSPIDDLHDDLTVIDPEPGPSEPPETTDHFNYWAEDEAEDGHLAALLAAVCERAMSYHPPEHADPGYTPHPGVQAAIRAFAAWHQAEGPYIPEKIPGYANGAIEQEQELVPLSLMSQWIAWSSDGMRIVAAAETLEDVERLAHESGEPEPIFQRHVPGGARRI